MLAGAALFVIVVSYLVGVGTTSVDVTTTTGGQVACSTSVIFAAPDFTTTGNMTVLLLLTVGLAGTAVIIGARRPRNGADPALAAGDDALRRRSIQVALATAVGTVIVSVAIAAADLLNISRAYAVGVGSGTDCSIDFSLPPGRPPAGWPFWTLQDNYYNALVAVMVACVLLALIAAASVTTSTWFSAGTATAIGPRTIDLASTVSPDVSSPIQLTTSTSRGQQTTSSTHLDPSNHDDTQNPCASDVEVKS